MIATYLKTRYVRGGRGPVDFDCWGLVRAARTDLFGRPLLPLLSGAVPGNLRAITKAHADVYAMHGFREVTARPGAIAEGWAASLCVHVGLVVEVDGRMLILETDHPGGACLTPINRFKTRFTRVLFFDDQS